MTDNKPTPHSIHPGLHTHLPPLTQYSPGASYTSTSHSTHPGLHTRPPHTVLTRGFIHVHLTQYSPGASYTFTSHSTHPGFIHTCLPPHSTHPGLHTRSPHTVFTRGFIHVDLTHRQVAKFQFPHNHVLPQQWRVALETVTIVSYCLVITAQGVTPGDRVMCFYVSDINIIVSHC